MCVVGCDEMVVRNAKPDRTHFPGDMNGFDRHGRTIWTGSQSDTIGRDDQMRAFGKEYAPEFRLLDGQCPSRILPNSCGLNRERSKSVRNRGYPLSSGSRGSCAPCHTPTIHTVSSLAR